MGMQHSFSLDILFDLYSYRENGVKLLTLSALQTYFCVFLGLRNWVTEIQFCRISLSR